jgi:hypothetical protein
MLEYWSDSRAELAKIKPSASSYYILFCLTYAGSVAHERQPARHPPPGQPAWDGVFHTVHRSFHRRTQVAGFFHLFSAAPPALGALGFYLCKAQVMTLIPFAGLGRALTFFEEGTSLANGQFEVSTGSIFYRAQPGFNQPYPRTGGALDR